MMMTIMATIMGAMVTVVTLVMVKSASRVTMDDRDIPR